MYLIIIWSLSVGKGDNGDVEDEVDDKTMMIRMRMMMTMTMTMTMTMMMMMMTTTTTTTTIVVAMTMATVKDDFYVFGDNKWIEKNV